MEVTIKNGVTIIKTGEAGGLQNSSGMTGVSWNKKRRKFIVQMKRYDTLHYLGEYTDRQTAFEVRKAAEKARDEGRLEEYVQELAEKRKRK